MTNDEAQILWNDVLDELNLGRAPQVSCPFCKKGTVVVTQKGALTRLECGSCRQFIEGQFANES